VPLPPFIHFVLRSRQAQIWILTVGLIANVAVSSYLFSPTIRGTPVVARSDATAFIHEIILTGRLKDLRWPDFSDYRVQLQEFYEAVSYNPVWIRDGQPKPQALAIIKDLQEADLNGLNAEDYDGSRWKERLILKQQPEDAARFDVALTVCLMRYISDRHIGRVNPGHFKFGLTVERKKYDLAQFVRDRFVESQEVRATLEEIDPPFPGYRRTLTALRHYLKLSLLDDGEKLPLPPKSIEPGTQYTSAARLARLLRLLGDLPSEASVPSGDIYEGPLVEAIKNFQQRHGLTPDGRLGEQTVKQLNTPLTKRVEQLRLTLERWRWVPQEFAEPPVVVNIPEFRLRTFEDNGKVALAMNVIVGKALRHETPVFEKEMRFVVFRPYWNVPPGIQRSEIVPAIQRDRNYLSKNNYEVITHGGQIVTSGAISDEVLADLRTGKLAIRQKPGRTNALGLVKLMFPNEYHVYLHSTPAPQLFAKSRRDFSHGCIRVEKPDELATWALRNNPGWSLERVQTAMESGQDDLQVNLAKPIPVLILYGTAIADEAGVVHFFEDLYGHDAALEDVLAKGYPFPN